MRNTDITEWMDNYNPNGDPPNLHSDFDDSDRDALIDAIEKFCRNLNTRLEIFARERPSTIDIFNSEEELKSEYVGQEVHSLLRDFLITSVVDVLGYIFLREPRPAQIESEIWSGDVYPDLRLIPQKWPRSEPSPVIVMEHKKFGRFEHAMKELYRDYLSNANGPVYGLATDVCTWSGYRVTAEGELEQLPHVSIRRLLQQVRKSVVYEGFEFDPKPEQIDRFLELFELLPGTVGLSKN